MFAAAVSLLPTSWQPYAKTLIAIVLSPLCGMLLAMTIMLLSSWMASRASVRGAERSFRVLHLISAATLKPKGD